MAIGRYFRQLFATLAVAFWLSLHCHALTYTLDGSCSHGRDLRPVIQEVQKMASKGRDKLRARNEIADQAFNVIFQTDNADTASRNTVRGLSCIVISPKYRG